MAAPTAAGAVALLIDAGKRYNLKHPEKALPLDPATLHRVLMSSARPFDINRYQPKTQKYSRGQYTWIDQGHGMVNLPAAWRALKKERDQRLPSAVMATGADGQKFSIPLDYEIRVLRKSPNGLDYTGVLTAPTPQNTTVPRFGRGIYLDMKATDSLVNVQIKRKLPLNALNRSDAGELSRQLYTSADTFELETEYYGSDKEWLKAGTLAQVDCAEAPAERVTVIGEGALDRPEATDADPRSVAFQVSNLNVCLNRNLLSALTPGDHGAIIKAFRVVDGKREPHPSFEVPVYLAVPHAIVAGGSGYRVQGTVKSFGVDRNYVEVPKGISVLTVTLEVPEAKVQGNVVSGCAGVELMMLEGENTATPIDLPKRDQARVANCDPTGAISGKRKLVVSRMNPRPGLWDIHVLGLYTYKDSAYSLKIDFVNASSSTDRISGANATLTGAFDFTINESSFAPLPSETLSTLQLFSFVQVTKPAISHEETKVFPDSAGVLGRSYDESIASASFGTGGLKGNDLDLKVLACDDVAMTLNCTTVATSAGATDEELATFTPQTNKFYAPEVHGFAVATSPSTFSLTETRRAKEAEQGTIKIAKVDGDAKKFMVDYSFDTAKSKLVASSLFQSGHWHITGDVMIRTADSVPLLRVSVEFSK